MSRLLLIFFSLWMVVSHAAPLTADKVPEPLKAWVNWVLQGQDHYQCPFFYNNFQQKQCAWATLLNVSVDSKQAHFSSQWQVYNDSWISLPGDKTHWPQQVKVNGQAALVMNKHGKPSIKLTTGVYTVTGDFFWNRLPESLAIPKNTGLFSLEIKGNKMPFPLIKKDQVWLKAQHIDENKPKNIANKVDLQVFRKVDDHVPLQLITHLELEVSGDQREIRLPHALLTDFIAISLNSPLPARIEPDGSLLVQVRAGRWSIKLNARYPKPVTQLTFDVQDQSWPDTEIWSFNAIPFQRLVEVKNLLSIDPSQTNSPKQWQHLPAYQIKQGETMVFKLIRRGDPEPEPNQLNLSRQLWLDFNGDAYTVNDTITGKMTQGWRINALPETQLGQVTLNGQSQLITVLSNTDQQGVEVRKGTVHLQADSRIKDHLNHLSAVGWNQNFHHVQAELNIPPGWRLLAARGVDNDPNSWISQWTLFDLFLLLISALAISQLWNIYWGVFALVALGLCWHEAAAPHFIWLNILATIALIRVLPSNKFQGVLKIYRNICWLALIIIVIPFMISQVRIGLYPQLEKQWQPMASLHSQQSNKPQTLPMAESFASDEMKQSVKKMRQLVQSPAMTRAKGDKNRQFLRIDPDANIQTGPGLPQWQWHKIHLSWNGSVDAQQQIRLWYLSPTVSMWLNFLSVFLVLILSLLMFGVLDKKLKFSMPLLNALILMPLLSYPVQDVQAAFPEQKMLDELKNRLLQAPDCLPRCADISTMDLTINSQNLVIKLQVQTQQAVAIPLPAQQTHGFPEQVLVNGKPTQALFRNNEGSLWLSLNKGHHRIELRGVNPLQNKFSLPLTLKPHRITITTDAWNVVGVHHNGRIDNQLMISRIKTTQQTHKKTIESTDLPTFVRVERTLYLDLDWRVSTRVLRIFNNDSAFALSIPLLQGESVTSANINVKDKQVLVNMSAKQSQLQWQSVLKKTTQINLQAPETNQWTEVWRVDVSPLWHLETTGIAMVHHQDRGHWLPEWQPWAGEKVSLILTRPKAVKGATLTIDNTELQIKMGKRSLETKLKLTLRSSKGTQHTVTLPEQVQLQSVKINGITQPIRQKARSVTLPIKPSKQNITLHWRKMQTQKTFLTTPVVDLGINSVNSRLKVLLGQDRWVLLTVGSAFGPAVLFWGVLIVMVLLSIGLGKIALTPLKNWQWLLLLMGLSQIPIESALIVVIWLIALGFRAKTQPSTASHFNLMQIGLGILTATSILLLFIAVQQGLLGSPDMQIVGNQSSAFNLQWYQDHSTALLPTATVISVPMMSYRLLMLLWSLWLAVSLLNWLKWGWGCFSSGGLWRKLDNRRSG